MSSRKAFAVEVTPEAVEDLARLAAYSEELETHDERTVYLATALRALANGWPLHAFHDRKKGIRVAFVEAWYSVFYRAVEAEARVIVIAIAAQKENIKPLLKKRP